MFSCVKIVLLYVYLWLSPGTSGIKSVLRFEQLLLFNLFLYKRTFCCPLEHQAVRFSVAINSLVCKIFSKHNGFSLTRELLFSRYMLHAVTVLCRILVHVQLSTGTSDSVSLFFFASEW